MKGKLITFEGIDGSGKSTQIKLLSEIFNNKGIKNIIIREPGGTLVSEKIRDILLDENSNINKYTETLLFLSSRAQLVDEIIIPALNDGFIVLCDRYIDSTVAYQGHGRGIDISKINTLNDIAINNIYPDLTFIFDIDIGISLDRISLKLKDRMEQVDINFIAKVKKGYLEIANQDNERCFVINCNNKNIDSINNVLLELINSNCKGIF